MCPLPLKIGLGIEERGRGLIEHSVEGHDMCALHLRTSI